MVAVTKGVRVDLAGGLVSYQSAGPVLPAELARVIKAAGLSTIKSVDRIVVLEVAEIGTQEVPIRHNGVIPVTHLGFWTYMPWKVAMQAEGAVPTSYLI